MSMSTYYKFCEFLYMPITFVFLLWMKKYGIPGELKDNTTWKIVSFLSWKLIGYLVPNIWKMNFIKKKLKKTLVLTINYS